MARLRSNIEQIGRELVYTQWRAIKGAVIRMVIRAPLHDDIEMLIELGAEMHRESAYAFLPYDRGKIRALIVEYIEDRTTRCALVADAEGTLVGMIGGTETEYYFCDETLVADEVLFVRPNHRYGMVALRLIRGLQEWATRRGARELCLSVSTNVNCDMTGKLYERLGFTQVGGVFKKRLNGE
jgi:GNAT superfamily N-acetyltransferase